MQIKPLAVLAPLLAFASSPGLAAAPTADAIIPLPLNPIIPAAQRACAAKSPSLVGTTALKSGVGDKPAATDTVLVNYIGYLAATGIVFDQATQAAFPVGEVIPGFAEGIRTIGRGGITRICVPAALGYGDKASGPIPPNSDLVFQVELLDFRSTAEIQAMQQQAQVATPQPTQ